jgi:hypothetical protein
VAANERRQLDGLLRRKQARRGNLHRARTDDQHTGWVSAGCAQARRQATQEPTLRGPTGAFRRQPDSNRQADMQDSKGKQTRKGHA